MLTRRVAPGIDKPLPPRQNESGLLSMCSIHVHIDPVLLSDCLGLASPSGCRFTMYVFSDFRIMICNPIPFGALQTSCCKTPCSSWTRGI